MTIGEASWRRAPRSSASTACATSAWMRQQWRSMISTAASKVGGAMRSMTVF